MSRTLNFGPVPVGPARSAKIPIFTPTARKIVKALLTGSEIVGVYYHWVAMKPIGCTYPQCEHCMRFSQQRWRGYISAISLPTSNLPSEKEEEGFLELTLGAARQLQELTQDFTSLRGIGVALKRRTSSAQSPVDLTTCRIAYKSEMPPALPGRPFCAKVYGGRKQMARMEKNGELFNVEPSSEEMIPC